MAKNISVKMELPLDDGAELLPEMEKERQEQAKEFNKELEKAENVVVKDINNPKGVETPKAVELKTLEEKLILKESEDDIFNLTHSFGQAIEEVLLDTYLGDFTKSEIEGALEEACVRIIEGLDDFLKESYRKSDRKRVNESVKNLGEDFKFVSSLSSFNPWSGAVDTWEEITAADKLDELDALLEEIYPEGLSDTELNDILWFDADWILESLGLLESELEGDLEDEE